MKKIHLHILPLLLCCLCLAPMGVQAQIGVGTWRAHLNYNRIHTIQAAGPYVYAAGAQGLLRYHRGSGALQLLDKTTGLTDVGISTFAYDEATATLVIAYTNSNIDLLQDGEVVNVGGIRRSNYAGDKSIHHIRFHQRRAYVACAMGIVVLNLERGEIQETYYPGGNETYAIYDIAFTDSLIYAATDHGLIAAPAASKHLANPDNWSLVSGTLIDGLQTAQLAVIAGRVVVLARDAVDSTATLFWEQDGGTFVPMQTGSIRNMREQGQGLLLCRADSVQYLDSALQRQAAYGACDWMDMNVHDASMDADGWLWVAHDWAGAVGYNTAAQTLLTISPSRPWTDDVYKIVPYQNKMLLCRGGKTTTYAGANLSAVLEVFENETWTHLPTGSGADTLHDVVDVAVNPRNSKEWMACAWGHGLMHIVDGTLQEVYTEENTGGVLQCYTYGGYRTQRSGAVIYDAGGNAWSLNSLVPNGIAVRYSDGSWDAFDISNLVNGNEIDKLLFDSINGYLWFAGRANRIYVFHLQGDQVQLAYVNPNNGSKVETSSINCMVQDHNGDIWVGTNKGVKKIYDGYKAFYNGGEGELSPVTCSNILFSENGMVEYLMAYENITCMAVDGANRKWVGTASGGLYLLSASGLQQLEHFNTTNSPLFSNKIISVAVQPVSGEVFIGTDKGVQSYRGTAVYATGTPSKEIHAFPNPVKPDYDGPIAIKGFSRNALVHITDASGHTLFSTTAHGGQAIWNGRTNEGQRVASGVYFVFASDENGKNRAVTKILVVR